MSRSNRRYLAPLPIVAAAVFLAGCGPTQPIEIKALSNRPDLVSGGDVLVELTLPAGAADEIQGGLRESHCLPDGALDESDARLKRVASVSELVQAPLNSVRVVACLAQVRFEAVAVASTRSHRNLRL